VGNRARGERLHHQIDAAAFRAASVVLLTAPQTPLLFMGQEWAASSPFQYFTDHAEPLGRLVTEGRRREFRDFAAFAGDTRGEGIPDPQALSTFLASRLDWAERETEPHASVVRLYTALLAFRRHEFCRGADPATFAARSFDETTLLLCRTSTVGVRHLVVARLRGAGVVDLHGHEFTQGAVRNWVPILTSEDPVFSPSPAPILAECSSLAPIVRFARPGAIVLSASLLSPDTSAGTGLARDARSAGVAPV
jgi:maltooligosyltrehalose trehalohydrolase